MAKKIMIIAGEASGDLHGSGLVRELIKNQNDLKIFGIGGDKMSNQGMELLYHINEMSVIGFWDVIKQFRFFRGVYKKLVQIMDTEKPSVLVLIDYPGLNLKLAKAAHEKGIPVLYYIAPQVWAWGAGRIKKIAKIVTRMAVIIPFEEKMYRDAGIDATFVGHPLLEVIKPRLSKKDFFKKVNLNPNKLTIGLLPGSRTLEVKRLLPEMIATIKALIKQNPDIQSIIGSTDTVESGLYDQIVNSNSNIQFVEGFTYEIMKHCDLLIVASGTATLESALFETPLIIVYKVDPLSYFLGKLLVKIDFIGLVNVIAEKKIVPEFIQNDFKKENIIPAIDSLLFDKTIRKQTIQDLKQIKEKLGKSGASNRTAEMVIKMID